MTGHADLYRYQATIEAWIDGDTARVDVDLGCHVHWQGSLRCAAYDAPEIHGADRPAGLAASAFVRQIVPPGMTVYLDSLAFEHGDEQDDFGRMLAIVTLPDGSDLASLMITAGHATPYPRSEIDR